MARKRLHGSSGREYVDREDKGVGRFEWNWVLLDRDVIRIKELKRLIGIFSPKMGQSVN